MDKLSHISSSAQQIVSKLTQLDQLINKMTQNELSIREQVGKHCQELKVEVDQIEAQQRKVQECLKNIRSF